VKRITRQTKNEQKVRAACYPVQRWPSIEPGGAPPFGLPADDLTGVMMGDPPDALFADKKIARRERTALELLLAQH
jgi:hypothetical protein